MSSPWASSQASATWAGETPMPRRHPLDDLDQLQVLVEILLRPARIVAPPVVGGQVVAAPDLAGQEAAAERAVGHEADAELAADGQDVVLDAALPERIFGLQRGDRVDRGGAAQRLGAGFGEAEMADLPLADQLGHAADRLLDRHVGIDAVLVEEVDRLDAEPLQRAFAGAAGIVRAAVDAGDRACPRSGSRTWSR